VSELWARVGRLWVYHRPALAVLNVVLVFGVVMGGVALLAPGLGLAGVFAVGFAIGLVYEIANLAVLHWWFFPDDRLLFLRGPAACAVGVAVAWGVVPAAVARLSGLA
jgi:multisubunit Na+/H+ antiporter MnhB subunit